MINVTTRKTCEDLFPNLDINCHQHTFRVAPFRIRTYERFWLATLKVMNATFTIEKVRRRAAQDYFMVGTDIVPFFHSYSTNTRRFRVYPVLLTLERIVVPEAVPYSGFYSYLRTLASNEFFAYCTGTVVAIVLTLCVCRYIKEKQILFFESLMDVLNLLINDNGYINYRRLSHAEIFVLGPLTFVGFIVVNGYLSNIQSYVTSPVLQPQMKTFDDIYNSPLNIAVPSELRDFFLEQVNLQSTDKDWSNKIVGIEKNYRTQFLNFNTSTSYFMVDHNIEMLFEVQRQLGIRGFYDTGITVTNSLAVFLMLDSIIFYEKLNDIIHRTHSSGLLNQWQKEHFAELGQRVLNHNRLKKQRSAEDEFEFPMFVVYGWIASSVFLLIEIVWSKVR